MKLVTVTLFWPMLDLPYTKMTGYSDTPFIVTRLAVGVQQNIRLQPIVKIFAFGRSLNLTQYLMEVTVLCFVGCNSISA